jgi:uncharacterized membrane protein
MRYLLVFLLLLAPVGAEAAGAPKTLRELSELAVSFFGQATITLVAVGVTIYMWNIARDFEKMKEGEADQMRLYYFWGIIIIFVMVSIWGILEVLQNTVLSGQGPGVRPPGSVEQDCTLGNCFGNSI